jgi:hypothetical protein
MDRPVFTAVSDDRLAALIKQARQRVTLACPAIRSKTSAALLHVSRTLGPNRVAIIVDCDDEVFRLGYGDL